MKKAIDDEQIVRMYCDEKKTTWEIAAAMGIAQATVYSHLKKLGKIRDRKMAQRVRYERKPPKYYVEDNGHGYSAVFMPSHPNAQKSGYILEHRLIMSQLLGRPLRSYEQVHHLNGNGRDNRPENLVLLTSNAEHKRYHRMSDAELLERLRRYANETGTEPTIYTCCLANGLPSYAVYARRFGSWTRAKMLAGVTKKTAKTEEKRAA